LRGVKDGQINYKWIERWTVLLVTVDGRQPGDSIGMSLTMLADPFIEFSAVEAINLDGGLNHDGDPEQASL